MNITILGAGAYALGLALRFNKNIANFYTLPTNQAGTALQLCHAAL